MYIIFEKRYENIDSWSNSVQNIRIVSTIAVLSSCVYKYYSAEIVEDTQ